MNELKKHALLLSIILLLAAVKFVIVPVFEWQNMLISELNLKEKKLKKTHEALSKKESLIEKDNQINTRLEELLSAVFEKQDESQFRRNIQKVIETDLAAYQLSASSIGWVPSVNVEGAELQRMQIDMSINGNTEDIVRYLLLLSTVSRKADILNLRVLFRGQSAGDLGASTTRLSLAFFMLTTDINHSTDIVNSSVEETVRSAS